MSLDEEIERALVSIDEPRLREAARDYLQSESMPALRAVERIDTQTYLEVGMFEWLIGRRKGPPTLGRLDSKCGGLPYIEDLGEWPERDGARTEFVGQLNFGEVAAHGAEHLPEHGLLVIYLSATEDEMFDCRWYPEPTKAKCVDLGWPQPSVDVERRIELGPALSYRLPASWGEVLPEEVAACDGVDALELVDEAIFEVSANVGALPYFGLDGPGPRQWLDWACHSYDDWLVLFHPLEGWWGSMFYTLMIRPEDLRARRFENARTLCWQ